MAEQVIPREEGIFTGVIPGVREGKIYNDSVSKDVEKYVIFANLVDYITGNEFFAFKDQACTEKMTYEELRNAFIKGSMIIVKSEMGLIYLTPYGFMEAEVLMEDETYGKVGVIQFASPGLASGFTQLVSAEAEYMGK